MRVPYELYLAGRNLARNPCHTLAMVLGLALAVLVMVYIPSTMLSFYDDMIDRTVEQNSAHITIWPREKPHGQMARALRGELPEGSVLSLTDRSTPRRHDMNGYHAIARQVAASPGIIAVAAFARGDAAVRQGKVTVGIVMEGIEPELYARVVNIAEHFPEGRVPRLGPSDIAIGFRLAEKLGVHTGEHIRVTTARTRRKMRVRAIFRCGYYEKDLHHAYVTLSTAQRLFRMGNEVSGLAARCEDLGKADSVSETLRRSLPQKVRNWRDDNASLLAEIATVKRVTAFISVLVALVTCVGMANVFSMFVLNRQKELAILRAMGASRPSLRTILLLEGLFIWIVGTVIGCTASLAVMAWEQVHPYEVSAETYGIGSYATQPKIAAFVLTCGLAAATMAVSALWSGRRAVKLNPADVIFGR